LTWKSLVGFVTSAGVLTYAGATNAIPQWPDLGIIAAFSLLVYFWALAVRLPDEHAKEYIGDVKAQIGATEETAPETAPEIAFDGDVDRGPAAGG
jgi:hypothetical protein